VRPNANQIALQYQPNFGSPAQIHGHDKDVNLLWSQELPIEFDVTIVCHDLMEYETNGNTLYFSTARPYTSTFEAHSYLHSLDAR